MNGSGNITVHSVQKVCSKVVKPKIIFSILGQMDFFHLLELTTKKGRQKFSPKNSKYFWKLGKSEFFTRIHDLSDLETD